MNYYVRVEQRGVERPWVENFGPFRSRKTARPLAERAERAGYYATVEPLFPASFWSEWRRNIEADRDAS